MISGAFGPHLFLTKDFQVPEGFLLNVYKYSPSRPLEQPKGADQINHSHALGKAGGGMSGWPCYFLPTLSQVTGKRIFTTASEGSPCSSEKPGISAVRKCD